MTGLKACPGEELEVQVQGASDSESDFQLEVRPAGARGEPLFLMISSAGPGDPRSTSPLCDCVPCAVLRLPTFSNGDYATRLALVQGVLPSRASSGRRSRPTVFRERSPRRFYLGILRLASLQSCGGFLARQLEVLQQMLYVGVHAARLSQLRCGWAPRLCSQR